MKILMETESERDAFLERCDERSCVDCILYQECSNELFMLEKFYKIAKRHSQIQTILIQKGDRKENDT